MRIHENDVITYIVASRQLHTYKHILYQEKMRGQRGRLPVQALGYVNLTKVILGLPETAGVNFLITFLRRSRNLETAVHWQIRRWKRL